LTADFVIVRIVAFQLGRAAAPMIFCEQCAFEQAAPRGVKSSTLTADYLHPVG
jgi:hypothetical protein